MPFPNGETWCDTCGGMHIPGQHRPKVQRLLDKIKRLEPPSRCRICDTDECGTMYCWECYHRVADAPARRDLAKLAGRAATIRRLQSDLDTVVLADQSVQKMERQIREDMQPLTHDR